VAGAFTVTLRLDDREIQAALTRLGNKARRLSPALLNIGEALLRSTKGRFSLQQDPVSIHAPVRGATGACSGGARS